MKIIRQGGISYCQEDWNEVTKKKSSLFTLFSLFIALALALGSFSPVMAQQEQEGQEVPAV
jgi:hypothetical protein